MSLLDRNPPEDGPLAKLKARQAEEDAAYEAALAALDRLASFPLPLENLHELPGWSALGPGIDHVLVRGLSVEPLLVWPEERRRQNGLVLSDHAPVEVTLS